ncbi:hypothetical protein L916_05247 [Phytophthora nicotianae]|nr:hypothetical protein L916_05247 [Phytophthora nicotianae]
MLSRITFGLLVAMIVVHYTKAQGVLTFWDGANFTGQKMQIHRWFMGQTCYNDHVRQPSSITWENLPTTGFFDGKSKIAFYTKEDCKGIVRAWFTTEKDFPTNLTIDGINDSIQSFMVWQLNKNPRKYDHPNE